jgi:antitoxin ParD1/3/4
MSQLNVEVPPEMERWIQSRVTRGRYLDAGEYLRSLVRREQAPDEEDVRWLRARYERSLASGIIDEEPETIIEQIIAELPGDDD